MYAACGLRVKTMNCFGCIVKPYAKLGAIFGCPGIHVECVHINGKASVPNFSIFGKYWNMITYIVILYKCLNIYYMVEYAKMLYGNQNYGRLFTLSCEFYFSIGSILCCLIIILKRRTVLLEMNEIAKIFEKSKYYGITFFFTPKMMKKSEQLVYVCVLFLSVNIISVIVLSFIFYDSNRYTYFMVKIINRMLCIYIQNIIILHVVQYALLYRVLFKTCCQQTMKILIRKLDIPSQCLSLEVQLQRLHRLYSTIEFSYRKLNIVIRLEFLLWFFSIMLFLVINNYLLIATTDYSKMHVMSLFYSYIYTLEAVIYLYLVQHIANTSEDILSFLFKYPISKLNTAEAAQVEMLITTLKIQKPVLRASDIFTVGTRLLASISGTVVTYVLVALQFHASWAK